MRFCSLTPGLLTSCTTIRTSSTSTLNTILTTDRSHVLYENNNIVSLICHTFDWHSLTKDGHIWFWVRLCNLYSTVFFKTHISGSWSCPRSQRLEATLYMTYKRCHQGVYYKLMYGLDRRSDCLESNQSAQPKIQFVMEFDQLLE